MNTKHYRTLRLGIVLMGVAYAAATVGLLYAHFDSGAAAFGFKEWCLLLRGTLAVSVGLAIALKLRTHHEHIYFALFLLNFGFNSILGANESFMGHALSLLIISTLTWSLSAGGFIYAIIRFPGSSSGDLYAHYFARSRPVPARSPARMSLLKRGILYLTVSRHFWLRFFPALLAIIIIAQFLDSVVFSIGLNVAVMLAGIIYFRVSYSVAHKSDRSELAWLLWGIVLSLGFYLLQAIVVLFFPHAPSIILQTLFALETATQCIALIMSVFFSGTINAGLVVRGTIIYSAIFLAVIFLFSVLENLIQSEVSEMLHVESDITGAFLSAVLALLIQPLHKKLEQVLPKF